jgi:hypothetical protein
MKERTMGYRSDVVAVFYTNEPDDLAAIKLFVDENIPEIFRNEDDMSVFSHGIKFDFSDVKWYPSYPDVKAFEDAFNKFVELSNSEGSNWMCEFVRIGEELEDIECTESNETDSFVASS